MAIIGGKCVKNKTESEPWGKWQRSKSNKSKTTKKPKKKGYDKECPKGYSSSSDEFFSSEETTTKKPKKPKKTTKKPKENDSKESSNESNSSQNGPKKKRMVALGKTKKFGKRIMAKIRRNPKKSLAVFVGTVAAIVLVSLIGTALAVPAAVGAGGAGAAGLAGCTGGQGVAGGAAAFLGGGVVWEGTYFTIAYSVEVGWVPDYPTTRPKI